MQIAYDLSSQKIPVWFLSLEMDVHSLLERLFCHVMSVDNYSVLSGQMKMDKGIQRKFLQFKDMMQDSTLLITEGIGKNWEDITQLIEAVGEKPKVIIVDYIQNIAFRSGDTREIINDYIRRFRNLAIKHGFAGVLCSQINRGAEQQKSNEPILAQLKETGFLEESADMVLLLYWKSFYEPDNCETSAYMINIAKNRNGRTGLYKLFYTPKYYRFTEETHQTLADKITEKPDEFTQQVDLIKKTFNATEVAYERRV
jgi:replicative DNA helicase